jgi:ligand-binding sensor domain-containing protein
LGLPETDPKYSKRLPFVDWEAPLAFSVAAISIFSFIFYLNENMNRKTIILVLCLAGFFNAVAQSRYQFHTLGMEQGLSSEVVWSVCKDKYNYVWMATGNGLNRYDGHRIKQYLHDPADSFSIPGNRVYWVHKDVEGGLWAVCGIAVSRYNYQKDRFERFTPYDSIVKTKSYGTKLWRMNNDNQGRLYFANGSSCFRYTLGTKKMEDLTPLFGNALKGHDIGMFVPEGNNILWITTNNGLFRYDLQQNSMRHFPFDAQKFGFGDANMHDLEFINDHQLLVAVMRAGFVLFDTRTGLFSLPPAPIDPSKSRLFSETGAVLKDKNGRIWLANSRYGLLEYFPKTNTVYSLKNEPSYPYPYAEQEGSGLNVYEDEDGIIWYGSSARGVIWFNPSMDFIQVFPRDFSKAHTLPANTVTFFQPMAPGKMLIGTLNGLVQFDECTQSFINYPVGFLDKDPYPSAGIRCMIKHGDSIFMTTNRGLSIYNIRTNTFSRYADTASSYYEYFPYGQWLLHYLNGEVLVTGQHAARFNLLTKQYNYNGLPSLKKRFAAGDLNASYHDVARNILWLEADTGRLFSYNPLNDQLQEHTYSPNKVLMIDAIAKDRQDNIWVGCTSGLFLYNSITRQSKKIVLPIEGPAIYNISLQGDSTVWLSTAREILRYNRFSNKVDILSINDVFPNSRITKRAFLLDENGMLWVGTSKGFCKIDTRRFSVRKQVAAPQLTGMTVFDKTKNFQKPLSELERIVLRHDENFFSFYFSSFNYNQQNAVNYSYRLEGFDNDWRPANTNQASYTNVPPGTYQLRIRSNEAGEWVERTKAIEIKILPPFWQSTWFLVLLAVAASTVLLVWYTIWKKRKKKKAAELQAARESEMQLLEIKKLLAESQLMALRAQMNPHFVFNCLNSIQECIVTKKYNEASLYLNKFSKLFRSVLNNSGRSIISLTEEIEVLELYLTLEHMRFEQSFTYKIQVEEDMDTDDIMIPSMLLQPYVENALWHGLMHKDGDRQLHISFTMLTDELYRCTIDDNGVGRKRALQLKEEQYKTRRHVSHGMSISKDRMSLLQKQGDHAVLNIIDKYDEAGNATGTCVVVELSAYLG